MLPLSTTPFPRVPRCSPPRLLVDDRRRIRRQGATLCWPTSPVTEAVILQFGSPGAGSWVRLPLFLSGGWKTALVRLAALSLLSTARLVSEEEE